MGWGYDSVAKCISMCEALGSILSKTKNHFSLFCGLIGQLFWTWSAHQVLVGIELLFAVGGLAGHWFRSSA